MFKSNYLNGVMETVIKRNPAEPEFHQAVREVLESLEPVIAAHPEFEKAGIIERIVEPERVISFRVPWLDDNGNVQVNRSWASSRFSKTRLQVFPSAAAKAAAISTRKARAIMKLCVSARAL